jgi:uncharacterized membrane protein
MGISTKDYKLIIHTNHGKILLLGIFLVLLLACFIVIYYFIDVEFANKISAMVVANIAIGRVPSLSLGYASELSHLPVIATNVYIEMVMVTLIYSIFVFSYNNMLQIRFLDDFFKKVKEYRLKYEEFFHKYGLVGLFIFVFIPFWMTGPIVGAIIGYLIGLRHITVMVTVFVSTVLAMTMWGLLLNELISLMNLLSTSAIWIVLGIVVILVIVLKFYKK